ncbi:MAG: hypothetical protein WBM13_14850 [Bacteroidia bacterium]
MKLLKPQLFLYFFIPLCILLSLNKHSKDKANSYHGVIWADAAGYYVYQPIWFIYGNNASALPDSVSAHSGYGFQLDSVNNTIKTKYPSGVAILQSPFFLAAHFLAQPLGFEPNGFSKIYSFALYVAGVFYCCLGLFLLSSFLLKQFNSIVALVCPFLFLLGTNLYYYSIDAPGMSHVYSFFLFSFIVYLTPKIVEKPSFKSYLLFTFTLVLILLTRPTNVIIASFPLFYAVNTKQELINRFKLLFSNPKIIFWSVLLSIPLCIPQLIYWHQTTGNLFIYSYGNESFSNWLNPKLIQVWFSAKNGLFVYTPLVLLSVVGMFFMIVKIPNKRWEGSAFLALFLFISYLFASWWCWWFGCAFGARSFVEWYALLIIPFAYLIDYTVNYKLARYVLFVFIALCCYLNMDMEYYYDGCFYGDVWDFTAYLKLLNS